MVRRALIAAASLAAVLASYASAATVSLQEVMPCTDHWADCRFMLVLVYAGEGEERNLVSVKRTGASIVVVDAAAPLRAGPLCVATGATSARCDLGLPLVGYRLDGGFGADTITVVDALSPTAGFGGPRLLAGGPGDDLLLDGADDSVLLGGPGSDHLSGGHGTDYFFTPGHYDDPGLDQDRDGAESDIVDGGPGFDTADYRPRTSPLRLQPSGQAIAGGEPGEDDRLVAVERIVGGQSHDVLVGGASDDVLEGSNGNDVLEGGDGNDELVGGGGDDRLAGGRGDDVLGGAVRTACGPGHDVIGWVDRDYFTGANEWQGPLADDVVALDCERVGLGPGVPVRPRRRGRRVWEYSNPCAAAVPLPRRCSSGQITLALPGSGTVLAVAAFRRAGIVRVPLSPISARRLARAGRVAVRYSLIRHRDSPPEEFAFVLALR